VESSASHFAPTTTVLACLAFFTESGQTRVLIAGPLTREHDVEAHASMIWSSADRRRNAADTH